MRTTFLSLCSALLMLGASVAAPGSAITEREWKRRLSPTKFEIGTSRAQVEKRLAAKIVGEEIADHGFAPLRDVYYELDAHWCALAAYQPTTGVLVVQPRLLPNTAQLHERLSKAPPPKQ